MNIKKSMDYLNWFEDLEKRRLGKSSLYNMGNTCYINAVIQSLVHNPYLVYYIQSDKYHDDIKKTSSKAELLTQFVRLVKGYYTDNCRIRPTSLRKQIGNLDDRYSGSDQNDAHEFLASFVDWLHDALSYEVEISVEKAPKTQRDMLEVQSIKEWENFFSREYSPIVNMYYGQYQTTTSCSKCGFIKNRFDPYCYLTLTVSDDISNIYDGLDQMVKPEELDKDNFVKCDRCNEKMVSTQKTSIWRTPYCLFIVLKRFSMTGAKNGKLIDFPLEGLDLSSYVEGYDQGTDSIYDLYSVVNHRGSHFYGHYTNTSKNFDGNWIYFDDDKYQVIDDSSVVSSSAYILCYIKRNFFPEMVKGDDE